MPEVRDSPPEQPTTETQTLTTPQVQPRTNWPLIVFAGFGGLILLGVIIYAAYSYGKATQPPPTPTPTPIVQPTKRPSPTTVVTPTKAATPAPDVTAGWKTYRNETHGFQIKYPDLWKIEKEDYDADSTLTVWLRPKIESKSEWHRQLEIVIGGVCVYSTSGAICANQWCEEDGAFSVTIEEKNYSAPIIKASVSAEKKFDYYSFQFFLTNPKGQRLYITASYFTTEQLKEIEQILSTFKFTEAQKSCQEISEADIIRALPNAAGYYKVKHNGYNPNKCYYSINIYFPDDLEQKKDRIDPDVSKNLIVGCWVIDTEAKTAKRIAHWPEYIFSQWVDQDKIEVFNDGEYVATIINLETGSTVSKRIHNIGFIFKNSNEGDVVTFSSVKKITGCDLKETVVQNWVRYPFDCVKQSDILIAAPGYNQMLLKYLSDTLVSIDGRSFEVSPDKKASWIIEL